MQFHKRLICLTMMLWCLIIPFAFAQERNDVDNIEENVIVDNIGASSVDDNEDLTVGISGIERVPIDQIEAITSDDVSGNTLKVDSNKNIEEDKEEPVENTYSLLRVFTGLYYQNTYSEINNHLVDHVEKDDAESNMIEAVKWYNTEVSKNSIFNRAIVEALKQFIALTKIGPNNKCNRNTYTILLKNDRATRGKAHKQRSKLGLFKRIEKIVYEYSMHHAIDCVPRYPALLKDQLAQMDQEKVQKVENFVNNIIDSFRWADKKFNNENKRYATYTLVKSLSSIINKKTAKIALDTLDEYARADPERRFLKKVLNEKKGEMELRKDKIGSLVEKYLVEPCRYYVEQLGLNVLIPANYDLIMLDLHDRYKEDDDNALEFLLGWSRYHVCTVIIDKDSDSLKKVVAKAATERIS